MSQLLNRIREFNSEIEKTARKLSLCVVCVFGIKEHYSIIHKLHIFQFVIQLEQMSMQQIQYCGWKT